MDSATRLVLIDVLNQIKNQYGSVAQDLKNQHKIESPPSIFDQIVAKRIEEKKGDPDDTEALKEYMSWTVSQGLHVLTLDPGRTYRFSEPLVLDKEIRHIIGLNVGSGTDNGLPTLLYNGPANTYAITASDVPHGSLQGFRLRSEAKNNNGLNLYKFGQCKIHDLHIENFLTGMKTSHFWVGDWSNIRLIDNDIGWHHTKRDEDPHSDCNALFVKNLQALHNNKVGILFGEGTNIRKVDISGNIEGNGIGVEFKNFKAIQNLRISAYWEGNSESDVRSEQGKAMSSIRPRIDLSDSYFFSGWTESGWTEQVLDIDNTNAKEILEIILDRCDFINAPKNKFLKTSGSTSFLRLFSDDCNESGGGGPSSTSREGWKRSSKGPNVSTIAVPLLAKFSGKVIRSVSRDGVKQLRGELTLTSNASGTVEVVWDSGQGVFTSDFDSFSGGETYHTVYVNNKPQLDTYLRIKKGEGALTSSSPLTLTAGDTVKFEINSFRPPG